VLYYAVTTLLRSGHEGVYAAVERPLQLAQTAAVLEVPPRPPDLAALFSLCSVLFCSELCVVSSPDSSRARRAGEVAGVGHAAADWIAALRHLGHPLELPRGQLSRPPH
jgi:hypothetical protein